MPSAVAPEPTPTPTRHRQFSSLALAAAAIGRQFRQSKSFDLRTRVALSWSTIEEVHRTNSKLLLIAEADVSPPIAVLANNLPWARHLGPRDHPTATAIDRVAHHLATTSGIDRDREQAAEMLERRQEILERYRELTADHDRSRERNDRDRDIGYGIDR
jgi:uncharacterized membrane protein YccC